MTFQVELCYFSFAWLRSKNGEKSLLVEENAVEIRGVKELKKIEREREKRKERSGSDSFSLLVKDRGRVADTALPIR